MITAVRNFLISFTVEAPSQNCPATIPLHNFVSGVSVYNSHLKPYSAMDENRPRQLRSGNTYIHSIQIDLDDSPYLNRNALTISDDRGDGKQTFGGKFGATRRHKRGDMNERPAEMKAKRQKDTQYEDERFHAEYI
eukprot:97494_1